MKNILPFTYFIFTPLCIFAQPIQPLWERAEATDGSTGTQYRPLPIVLVDSFHNVIVCGETYNPGPLIGFVTTKYDSDGNFLWQRRYDTPAQDIITTAVTDNAGAVYVGGNSINPLTNKVAIIIIKYAPDGDTLWQFLPPVVPSSYFTPSALLLDPAQNLLVFSNSIDPTSNNSGLLVTKLNPNGDMVWEAVYDEGDYGYIGIDARWVGENVVYWGQKGSPEGTRFFVWQIDSIGATVSSAASQPYNESFGRGYYIDQFGNLFIGDQHYEYKVTKFQLNGLIDWVYDKPVIFPPPIASAVHLECIVTDSSEAVYISGLYNDTTGFVGVTTKLSSAGEFLWEHRIIFNGVSRVIPQSNKWITENLLLVTGVAYTSIDSNFYELFLAFYDQNGLVKAGISDIDSPRNRPVSISHDGDYFYITGMSSPLLFSDPDKQFLCKYAMDEIITTILPAGNTKILGNLLLMPNPFRDRCQVSVHNTRENAQGILEIRDVKGNVLYCQQIILTHGDNYFEINALSDLPSGVYWVSLSTSNKVYFAQAIKGT